MQETAALQITYPQWYLYSQLCVCLMASIIFGMLYKYSIPEADSVDAPKREKGLLFIALATLTWALWPGIALLYGISAELRIYFSTLNNVFLLLAVAFFEYGPRRLRFFQLHERWVWVVICGGLIVASITSHIDNSYWQNIPDVVLSSITLAILGWAICVTFYHRIFKEAAIIAGLIAAYIIYAQLLELTHLINHLPAQQVTESQLIVILTSKILLIMILLLVAISWLHEQWLTQVEENKLHDLPDNKLHIHITGKRDPESQRRWLVKLQFDSGTDKASEITRSMTVKPHLLLVQFALRQQRDPDNNGGMMNTIADCFYHADLNKIHKLLELEVPALFKNDRRNGRYSLRNNIDILLDEKELAKDPDLLALMKKEKH